MPATLIHGKLIADHIKSELQSEVEFLRGRGVQPCLRSISIGHNPSSELYIKNQRRSCEKIGIRHESLSLPEDISEDDLIRIVQELNRDPDIHGLIIEQPLPRHIDPIHISKNMIPVKDVEGMNPINLGQVVYGSPPLSPCTAQGAMELIRHTGVELRGADAVIVGHSSIVGKPMALLLLDALATTTVCHIATKNLSEWTKRAEILVVAVGKPNLIRGDMIRPGAVVIDIGINLVAKKDIQGNLELDENRLPKQVTVGDVCFEEAQEVAGFLTPVPGGIGPLTVTMLMKNTVTACKLQNATAKLK